jgi:TIR domain-containing protein/pentapeptide repeat protein
MANLEQLDILLKQGVQAWNQWMEEDSQITPDLSNANLCRAHLETVNLLGANLEHANLSQAHLESAILEFAYLSGTDLSNTHLERSYLEGAILEMANLNGAYLEWANLQEANLDSADLRQAHLRNVDFRGAFLEDADLSQSFMQDTILGNIDLSKVIGLDTVNHLGPSTIGIDTIVRSQGKISEIFLRNAGIPSSIIDAIPSLISSLSPIDYYSCFISYSSKDQVFAELLHADLHSKGVRCWFASHDMRIGDEIRPRIDESIRRHDKLLLVLSESSITSTWVKKEVETTFEKEAQQHKPVLFPIRLDDSVMHTQEAWAADIRRMRHIGDFRLWKRHGEYQKALKRLLRDLQAIP